MDDAIQKLADSLYQKEAAALRQKRQNSIIQHANDMSRRGTVQGGIAFSGRIAIEAAAIGEDMMARIKSFQDAFAEAQTTPTVEEARKLWPVMKEHYERSLKNHAVALNQYLAQQGQPDGNPIESLRSATAHRHDGVLHEFNLWVSRVELQNRKKPEPSKSEQDVSVKAESVAPTGRNKEPVTPLTEAEQKVMDLIVENFLALKTPTNRHDLVRHFLEYDIPDLLERLQRYAIIKGRDRREYLPLLLAFEYSTNSASRDKAKCSIKAVLSGFYDLYMDKGHPEDREYSASEVEEAAERTGFDTKQISVQLGLYLAQDYGVLAGFRGNETEISHVRINENIAKTKIPSAWDSHVRQRGEYLERQRGPERRDDFLLKLYEAWNSKKRSPIPASKMDEIANDIQMFNGEHQIAVDALAGEDFIALDSSGALSLTSNGIAYVQKQRAFDEPLTTKPVDPKRVFLVHGQNEGIKQTVARFLEKHGLEVTILHEKANKGRTVIEKFVEHSNVGFAVVLLTADDFGGSLKRPKKKKKRARQNVILELGFFLAKLGRPRVCALYIDGVELPSDYDGVLWVPYDRHDGWRMKLLDELKEAGMAVT